MAAAIHALNSNHADELVKHKRKDLRLEHAYNLMVAFEKFYGVRFNYHGWEAVFSEEKYAMKVADKLKIDYRDIE